MPIYEYECKECGVLEIMQKITESPKRKCPECGTLGLRKLISAASFQLKGTGWYATDFRDKGKQPAKKADGEAGASESTSSSSDSASDKSSSDKSSGDKSSGDKSSGDKKDTSSKKSTAAA